MARNEEKQQGKLNRLWLQKEREEGRLKDVNERRPKLSALNSAPSVKKWIPSIKSEIEYCLQQSQLPHYPERKIAEFQLRIEALEKEYKSFIAKLRVLDPTCKHKPWTPRAYSKRRAEAQDSPAAVKNPRLNELHDKGSQESRGESDLARNSPGDFKSLATEETCGFLETRFQGLVSTSSISDASAGPHSVQDQPLSFDQTRLAVAAAAFRGPALHQSSSQTQNLARMLQSSLPNLSKFHLQQRVDCKSRKPERNEESIKASDVKTEQSAVPDDNPSREAASDSRTTEVTSGHILGLDCYSSSDEDTNA
uniref:Si:dkey-86e18.1 n=1 Tax=Fundulus heteroclitus TaxID=8078 RepID=A0A3Q2SN96_FUNHE